jgi:hypothetical protein
MPVPADNVQTPYNVAVRLTGTLSGIDDNILTLTGTEDTFTVIISDDARIQKNTTVTISELAVGESIYVSGDWNDDGSINAAANTAGQSGQMMMPGLGGNPGEPPDGAAPPAG